MPGLIGTIVSFIIAALAVLGLVPHQEAQPLPALEQPQQAAQSVPPLAQQAYQAELNASANQQASAPAAPTNNSQPISVPGMSQYTDTDFGFSFWYPSGWSAAKTSPQSTDNNGWFKDGSIVGVVTVHGNRKTNGVTIYEFHSSGLAITELGASMSASPVGVDQKYFFDTNSHTWMRTILAANGGKGGATYPETTGADVSNNTMGGLHVFPGAARFGADVIVPLSASNFLVVQTNDGGGYVDERLLAKTVLATDPSVATPVSAAEQEQTIQTEKGAYDTLDDTPLPPFATISSISPTTANPGDTVTVYGANFDSNTTVQLSSVAGITVNTKVVSSTKLTFVVPPPATLQQISEARSSQFPYRVIVQGTNTYTWPGIVLVIPGY